MLLLRLIIVIDYVLDLVAIILVFITAIEKKYVKHKCLGGFGAALYSSEGTLKSKGGMQYLLICNTMVQQSIVGAMKR